jgi:acetolactate synthase-1/3 small subunit
MIGNTSGLFNRSKEAVLCFCQILKPKLSVMAAISSITSTPFHSLKPSSSSSFPSNSTTVSLGFSKALATTPLTISKSYQNKLRVSATNDNDIADTALSTNGSAPSTARSKYV